MLALLAGIVLAYEFYFVSWVPDQAPCLWKSIQYITLMQCVNIVIIRSFPVCTKLDLVFPDWLVALVITVIVPVYEELFFGFWLPTHLQWFCTQMAVDRLCIASFGLAHICNLFIWDTDKHSHWRIGIGVIQQVLGTTVLRFIIISNNSTQLGILLHVHYNLLGLIGLHFLSLDDSTKKSSEQKKQVHKEVTAILVHRRKSFSQGDSHERFSTQMIWPTNSAVIKEHKRMTSSLRKKSNAYWTRQKFENSILTDPNGVVTVVETTDSTESMQHRPIFPSFPSFPSLTSGTELSLHSSYGKVTDNRTCMMDGVETTKEMVCPATKKITETIETALETALTVSTTAVMSPINVVSQQPLEPFQPLQDEFLLHDASMTLNERITPDVSGSEASYSSSSADDVMQSVVYWKPRKLRKIERRGLWQFVMDP